MYQTVCSDNEIAEYPTMLYFKKGKLFRKYQGSRQLDDFNSFLEGILLQDSDGVVDIGMATKMTKERLVNWVYLGVQYWRNFNSLSSLIFFIDFGLMRWLKFSRRHNFICYIFYILFKCSYLIVFKSVLNLTVLETRVGQDIDNIKLWKCNEEKLFIICKVFCAMVSWLTYNLI